MPMFFSTVTRMGVSDEHSARRRPNYVTYRLTRLESE